MVAQLVRRARERLGLTQTELAERSGLRQTYISQIENGDIKMPRDHNLDALGGVLGLGRADFYREAGMFDGVTVADPPPASPLPPSDDGPFDVAVIVAYVESRPGRRFQEQVAEEKVRLPRADYEAWCVDVFTAWMSNSNLALRSLRRGEQARDRGQDERT